MSNSLELHRRLEQEAAKRNSDCELSYTRPDPLLVAKRERCEYRALLCALFGYGSAAQIVKFLDSLDFSLMDADEATIRQALAASYYRFQSPQDTVNIFITLRRLRQEASLEALFLEGFEQDGCVIEGIRHTVHKLEALNPYSSRGYGFLLGKIPKKGRYRGAAPLKRWNMFLRWMVRKDCLDMGLWSQVPASALIIPLDTHTFRVSTALGLLKRRSYDLQAAIELTEALCCYDSSDPVKYDFALYRIGQEHRAT